MSASEPFELYGSVAEAEPMDARKDKEYSVGLSKNIILGGIQEQELDINRLKSQASFLEDEKNLLDFENGLKDLYHQYCIDKKIYLSMKRSYEEFSELYRKKQKAYEYQEISKVELKDEGQVSLDVRERSIVTAA